jgi:hypothetical protein
MNPDTTNVFISQIQDRLRHDDAQNRLALSGQPPRPNVEDAGTAFFTAYIPMRDYQTWRKSIVFQLSWS